MNFNVQGREQSIHMMQWALMSGLDMVARSVALSRSSPFEPCLQLLKERDSFAMLIRAPALCRAQEVI